MRRAGARLGSAGSQAQPSNPPSLASTKPSTAAAAHEVDRTSEQGTVFRLDRQAEGASRGGGQEVAGLRLRQPGRPAIEGETRCSLRDGDDIAAAIGAAPAWPPGRPGEPRDRIAETRILWRGEAHEQGGNCFGCCFRRSSHPCRRDQSAMGGQGIRSSDEIAEDLDGAGVVLPHEDEAE